MKGKTKVTEVDKGDIAYPLVNEMKVKVNMLRITFGAE